jgi:hypothetical protein
MSLLFGLSDKFGGYNDDNHVVVDALTLHHIVQQFELGSSGSRSGLVQDFCLYGTF